MESNHLCVLSGLPIRMISGFELCLHQARRAGLRDVFFTEHRNNFGHHHGGVVARFGEFASKILNTAQGGMISFAFLEKVDKNEDQED